MALYMTYLQFKYYLADDDMSPVSYQYFSNEKDKVDFPAVTVGIFGFNHIFKEQNDVFKLANVTPLSYRDFLEGKPNNYSEEHSVIRYDDVVLDINEGYLLSSYAIYTKSHTQSRSNFSMVPLYKLPNFIYFTKRENDIEHDEINLDVFELNATLLFEKQLVISISIHQKGRMNRSLRKPSIQPLLPKQYQHGAWRRYDINEVEVLRRRDKPKAPCNANLLDEESFIIDMITRNVGCVPTYWEHHAAAKMSSNTTFERCTSHEEYHKIQEQAGHMYWNYLKNGKGSLYLLPCTEMKVSTFTTEFPVPSSDILRLEIVYNVNSYKEIANTEAYTAEMLLGQIGGFVGRIYRCGNKVMPPP